MLSASSLPRGFKCLASLSHPQADFSTQSAASGNERHLDQETAVNAGDLSCLPDVLFHMIDGLTDPSVKAEVALAYNWSTDTARILGYGIARDYKGVDALEIPGTADLIATGLVDGKLRVIVADKKGFEEVEHPSENKQLLHNALCAARIFGVDEVTVCIHDEIRKPQFAVLDRFDLDAFAEALRILQTRMVEAKRNPRAFEVEGPWCKYCHAFEQCSLKQGLANQVESGAVESRLAKAINLGDDNIAAEVYHFRQRLYSILKRLDARIYARAEARPIPIGNGKVFAKMLGPGKRTLDAGKTEQAIRDVFEGDWDGLHKFLEIAIERSTSQAAIERAAKAVAGKGKIESTKKKIVDRVDELGGIQRKPTEEWGEFDDFGTQQQLKAVP